MEIRQYLSDSSIGNLKKLLNKGIYSLYTTPISMDLSNSIPESFNILINIEKDSFISIKNNDLFDSPNNHLSYYSLDVELEEISSNDLGKYSQIFFHPISRKYDNTISITSIDIYEKHIEYDNEYIISHKDDDVYYDKAIILNRFDGIRILLCMVDDITGRFAIYHDNNKINERLSEFRLRTTIKSKSKWLTKLDFFKAKLTD